MEFLTDLSTFTDYLPEIVKLHQKNNDRFPTGMGDLDVASELIKVFKGPNLTVLETFEYNNEIKFFSSIELFPKENKAFWWMVYSHPRNKDLTNPKMEALAQYLKSQGYTQIDSLTTRVTPSYKRWMKKLNFFPSRVYYKRVL